MPLTPIDPATLNIKWRGYRDGTTPTFSFGVSENTIQMTCWVDWDKIADAAIYFVGRSAIEGTGATAYLDRLSPYFLPNFPGIVCTKVTSVQGVGPNGVDANGIAKFRHAEMSLMFESVPYKVLGNDEISSELDRYVEVGASRGGATAFTLPGGWLRYARPPGDPNTGQFPQKPDGTGLPVPFNVSKIIPEESFTYVWHKLPEEVWDEGSVLKQRIYGTGEYDEIPYIGTINSAEFASRPTGTVLLESVDAVPQLSPLGDGSLLYTLTYNFKFRPSGWNWLFAAKPDEPPGTADFFNVTVDGAYRTADDLPDGTSIYNSRDFAMLFEVADI